MIATSLSPPSLLSLLLSGLSVGPSPSLSTSRKLTYMYKNPVLLNPGKQIGIQFSPPPALTLPDSNSMLKMRCRSPGCNECFLGRTTLTRRPAATINPYSRLVDLTFRSVSLMTFRCALRSLRHSSAESKVDGEPRVKPSASPSRRTSVPCSGRRRSVDGRFENAAESSDVSH